MKQILTTLIMIALAVALIIAVIIPIASRSKDLGRDKVYEYIEEDSSSTNIPNQIDVLGNPVGP